MIERQRESRRARTLTVIEPALASPLVSWVAGSVPACQPVCHQHCLVFSLRPSAFSLYTSLVLDWHVFFTSIFSSQLKWPLFPPFRERKGSALPGHVLCARLIFHQKLSLSRAMLWYDSGGGNKWPQSVLSERQGKSADTVKGCTCSFHISSAFATKFNFL